ncbi:MAG: enoyl-CoA hydratase/isomerase family protein [Candidatus Wallbacteria bacterium]|nr:enoyl-CoA hydratase/isomerase family protein [Candidatus Wallbacteria bacterium]
MKFETLLFREAGHIGHLIFNRPEKGNAINSLMTDELLQLTSEIRGSATIKALILSGSGSNFITGADINEFARIDQEPELVHNFLENGRRFMRSLSEIPQLTIAAVSGHALGGGLEVALACDYILAGESARFGLLEITLGLIPGAGGTQLLPLRVGPGIARRMILTGEIMDSATALASRLADRVVPDKVLLKTAEEIAAPLAKSPLYALRLAKKALSHGDYLNFESESHCFRDCLNQPEFRERVNKFISK